MWLGRRVSEGSQVPIIPADVVFIGRKLANGATGFIREAMFRGKQVVVKVTALFCTVSKCLCARREGVLDQGSIFIEKPDKFGIPPDSDEYSHYAKALVDEAELLYSLVHPNIVRVFGLVVDGQTTPKTYILMERGTSSLRSWLDKNRLISIEQLLLLSHNILSGLAFLHTRSPPIVHCDVKDDNVLVFVSHESLTAKLCDMDVAQALTGACTSVDGGAAFFKAPELTAAKPVTAKVDVFSFGVMLALIVVKHLSTGAGGSQSVPVALLPDHLDRHRYVETALARLDDVPVVKALIEGCVHTDGEKRWSSAQALEIVDILISSRNLTIQVTQHALFNP